MSSEKLSNFAQAIMDRTYAHTFEDGGKETWDNIAYRVTKNVLRAVGIDMRQRFAQEMHRLISERKFIPAGRYLYASGKQFHQTQNCLLLNVYDSREGWSELLAKSSMSLMTGAGIGVSYSDIRHEGAAIRKTGGLASGPIPLMQILNECGRGIMQGATRRSAIMASLRWDHPDTHKFIRIKNWPPEVCALKAKDFSFPATLDFTNTSVQLNDEFFTAYHDDEHSQYALAQSVYWAVIEQMLKTGDPGFSIDTGKNAGEILRNAPLSADTNVLTKTGYQQIRKIVNQPTTIWTGKQWAKKVVFKQTGSNVQTICIKITGGREIKADPMHEFLVERWSGQNMQQKKYRQLLSIERVRASELKEDDILSVQLPLAKPYSFDSFAYTLGYIFGDGFIGSYGQADLTLCTPEKKALLPYFAQDSISSITDLDTRGYTRIYFKSKTFSDFKKGTYPKLSRRETLSWLAGLFDADGSYTKSRQLIRLSASLQFLEKIRRSLECLGILATITTAGKSGYTGKQCYLLTIMASSVCDFQHLIPTKRLQINADNYIPYRISRLKVLNIKPGPIEDVFCCNVECEEHTFIAEGVTVSNCGEISSRDSDDICNLGSINLSRIENLDELKHVVDYATAFLLAGTVYSDVPYSDVDKIRSKNRRLGLGLMGIHEWLLQRNRLYAPDEELGIWLTAYAKSGRYANKWADEWKLSRPKKTRAIAPNGCQHPETLIVTDNGILELQEISENPQRIVPIKLKVAQECGKNACTSHLFRNGIVETRKIVLSSRVTLEATPNHKYRILKNGRCIWKRVDKMRPGDLLLTVLDTYKKTTEPELVSVRAYHVNEHAFKCPNKMTPTLACFLGIYFGDGSNHVKGIRISCNANKPQYIQKIADLGWQLFGIQATFINNGRNCISVCFNSRRLLRWLYVNALDKQYSRDIEFPRIIRESSRPSILEFINGFCLADGSQPRYTTYFDTASKKFATQLVCILRALGIEATESNLRRSGKGSLMHRVYKVKTRRRCHTKHVQQQLEKLGFSHDFTVDEIVSVKKSQCNTLDICVPSTKTYLANNFISHNTTSIIAETTGGIEPVFCVAYKRRYLKGDQYYFQYVIDPCAKRLIESGIEPNAIEDAYILARNAEKRVAFQAWIQGYVDHCISSTVNLPAYGTELNNEGTIRPFGAMLMRYLPQLRGITCYPDGSRAGQPLTPVDYKEALEHEGAELVEEATDVCSLKGGSCGD